MDQEVRERESVGRAERALKSPGDVLSGLFIIMSTRYPVKKRMGEGEHGRRGGKTVLSMYRGKTTIVIPDATQERSGIHFNYL